jgi:hypothetical protein
MHTHHNRFTPEKPGDGTAGNEAGSTTRGTARLWCARC